MAATLPKLRAIAGALGVTVDQLLGIALGREPTYDAWAAFLETSEARGMSDEERKYVASRRFPDDHEPTVLSYQLELMALRAATKRSA